MIEPRQDYLLVELDPLEEKTVQGIIIPEDSSANTVRTGKVLSTGPGRMNKTGALIPVDVSAGEKIAFFRWHLEHKNGKSLVSTLSGLGDNLGLIQVKDVLFTYSTDVRIG